jgi:tRNA A37 threonylcarbamoyltransferase TsaD
MLAGICKEHGARFGFASDDLNSDNGAMIAYTAERMLKKGRSAKMSECGVEQKFRIDQAVVV